MCGCVCMYIGCATVPEEVGGGGNLGELFLSFHLFPWVPVDRTQVIRLAKQGSSLTEPSH